MKEDLENSLFTKWSDERIKRVANGYQHGDELILTRLDGLDRRLGKIEKRLENLSNAIQSKQTNEDAYIRKINLAFISSFTAVVFSLVVFLLKFVLK